MAVVVFIYVSLLISWSHAAARYEGNSSQEKRPVIQDADGEPDLSQINDGEAAYTGDNTDDEPSDAYYEPFDPEKNGLLLHEYFDEAYKKFPDYDATTMRLNLNYYGDVLLADKDKNVAVNEEADVAKFTLDPEEKEMFINENDDQEKNDIQEARNDDNDNESESDDNVTTDEESFTEDNQAETDQFEDLFDNDNQAV